MYFKNINIPSILVVLWLAVLFSALFFTILFVSSGVVFMSSKNAKKYEDINNYYISHFNTISNKSSFGLAKIPSNVLRNKEFVSFRSKNNELFSVVSSKFPNEEFECYGTCLCNDKDSYDRRTINIFSKSLYFLISAFSLSLAIKIATDYFSEECFNTLVNICSSENIEPEINFCKSKYGTVSLLIEEKSDEEEKEKEIEEKEEYKGMEREFHCEGYCVKNGGLKHELSKLESEKYECEKYTLEERVTIVENGKLGFLEDETYKGYMKAKAFFEKEYLIPYCRSISKWKYEYVYTYPSGKWSVKKRNVNLCVGSNAKESRNNNICCHVLDPFTTWDGRRERGRFLRTGKM